MATANMTLRRFNCCYRCCAAAALICRSARVFWSKGVDWHIPLSRRIGISFFSWAVSLLIGERATDTTSGFCGMNRRATHVLATYLPQDYPDVESRVLVHKACARSNCR